MNLSVPDPRRPRVLRRFADQCRASTAADQPERLREAMRLTRPSVAPALIEVMISAQAFESAALALIGKDAAWMLSHSGEGRCLASLIAPGMDAEVTFEGATPALALLGAWASAGPAGPRATAEPTPVVRPASSSLH